MNYRHIYHAGNFADVMKHLAVALVLDRMKEKESPLFVLDAHGGCGMYDLRSEQAQKTHEAEQGILKFTKPSALPEDFRLYLDSMEMDLKKGSYPGSPLQIARALRPQDRLIANELHPEDYETLRHTLRPFPQTRITHLDAYEAIRANIPPKEKRGLILIDPPFEKTDEFDRLIHQMAQWKKRFATGVFVIWYPIKAHLPVTALKRAAADSGFARLWGMETYRAARTAPDILTGCGLLIFNAPYQVPERLEALLPVLAEEMGLYEAVSFWLTPP